MVAPGELSRDATVSKTETVQFEGGPLLNEAVKRNLSRFPPEFMFQLSELQIKELIANCDRFKMMKVLGCAGAGAEADFKCEARADPHR